MKVIIHDLVVGYEKLLQSKCNELICADGKYAGCQGCFACWTKRPTECVIHDSLKEISCLVGKADELVIITQNCYEPIAQQLKLFLIEVLGFQHRSAHIEKKKCTIHSVMGYMMK